MAYPRDMRVKQWANNGPEGTADVLLGNAAYRMAPFPMHDTSTGIEDAYMLAKRLGAANTGTLLSLSLSLSQIGRAHV